MRGVGRVGAVGDHDQAGERQARRARRARDRAPAPRRVDGAAVLQLAGRGDAVGRRREAEEPHDEFLRQRVEQRRVRAVQLLLHERAARLAVAVGDRHAARVVDQDAEKILLRHRGLEDQRRPEQAERAGPPAPPAAARRAPTRSRGRSVGRHAAIGQQREDGDAAATADDDQQDRPGQTPGEIALLKQQRRILEQKAEEVFQHLALILPGPAPLSRTHRSFFPGPPRRLALDSNFDADAAVGVWSRRKLSVGVRLKPDTTVASVAEVGRWLDSGPLTPDLGDRALGASD